MEGNACNQWQDKHPEGQYEEVESIISDRCWMESYKGDSKKWIMRDEVGKHRKCEQLSTMKDTYAYPEPKSPVIGRRTRMLLDAMLKEAEKEALDESNQPPVIEDYITTYDDTFCSSVPGFEPKDLPRSKELYPKYPLYGDQGMSYWQFQHERYFGDRRLVPGTTAVKDIGKPFKRNATFSKPLSDYYGGGNWDNEQI